MIIWGTWFISQGIYILIFPSPLFYKYIDTNTDRKKKNRIKDWLFGIAHDFPAGDEYTITDPESPAEALRSVYHAVSWHQDLGGAGIIPNHGRWKNVVAAFPLHDPAANAELLRKWSHALTLTAEDLDAIRALFGEKVL